MSEIGSVYILKHKTDFTLKYYVGSCLDVKKRWKDHKGDGSNKNRRGYNNRLYQYIRKNGGFDKFEMEVIYENKPDYKWFESKYIYATFHYNLNYEIPFRTAEEKKQRKLERDKKKYHLNSQLINKKKREKISCDLCGSIVCRGDIAKHKKSLKCAVLRWE